MRGRAALQRSRLELYPTSLQLLPPINFQESYRTCSSESLGSEAPPRRQLQEPQRVQGLSGLCYLSGNCSLAEWDVPVLVFLYLLCHPVAASVFDGWVKGHCLQAYFRLPSLRFVLSLGERLEDVRNILFLWRWCEILSNWKDLSVTEREGSRIGRISTAKTLWDFPLPSEERLYE